MKLPNAEMAVVDREKVTDYLLNPAHRYGSSKARFFADFGFTASKWELFADALSYHVQENEVAKTKGTPFGPRYEVEGPMNAPDGRRPRVWTIWQLDEGQIAPRLITAYPAEANEDKGT